MKVVFNHAGRSFQLMSDGGADSVEDQNRYLRSLDLRGLSPDTVRSYAYDLVVIGRWLKKLNVKIGDLTGKDLFDLIASEKSQGKSAKTINRRLITARVFYRSLFGRELDEGPSAGSAGGHYRGAGTDFMGLVVRRRRSKVQLKIKEDQFLISPLTIKEANEFIKGMTCYRDLSIVALMLFSGLRSCEVRTLEFERVNYQERKITVRGKGGRERMVPLTDQVCRLMKSYQELERPKKATVATFFTLLKGKSRGQPMTAAGLRSLFRHRRKLSGVTNANPHRFRHTFGTNMAQAKMNIRVLQELLGHAKGSPVTQRYIHIAMADVADAFYETNREIEKKYLGP